MKFLNDFKGEILKALIGLIVVFLIAKFDYVVSIFDKGKEIENQVLFENSLIKSFENDSVIIGLLRNKKFVEIWFNSPEVKTQVNFIAEDLRNKIVLDVTKTDSNKVSMRSFVGMNAEVRDEQVLPILSEMVKAWNEKEIAKKKDVNTIIKRSVKPGSLKPHEF
jgi:hypothetical protein